MERNTLFITGAASGIGRESVKKFIKEGWFVGAIDMNEDALSTLKAEVGEENIFVKKADITNEVELKEAVSEFLEITDGKMNMLSANAGIIVQKPFDEGTASAYRRLIDVNSFGAVNTIMASLDALKNTKGAKIVITSSSSAMFGIPHFAVYSSTKSFLKSLTEALSTEFKNFDIEVSSVMPLFVKTNMMNDIEDKYKALLSPESIAKVIYYAGTKGKKRHYLIGKGLGLMDFMKRIMPTKMFQKVLKSYLKID